MNNSVFDKKAATYSPTCVVPSALKGLTALFGMVRGETFRYNHLKSLVNSEERKVNSPSLHLYF